MANVPVRRRAVSATSTKIARDIQARIASLRKVEGLLLTEEFAKIAAVKEANAAIYCYDSFDSNCIEFHFSQSGAKSYQSNDEPGVMVANIFRAMDPDKYDEKIYAEHYNVDWTFRWEFDEGLEIVVRVNVYLDKTSQACRRIQTGTKEVPVYSFDCAAPADVVDPLSLPAPVLALEGKV